MNNVKEWGLATVRENCSDRDPRSGHPRSSIIGALWTTLSCKPDGTVPCDFHRCACLCIRRHPAVTPFSLEAQPLCCHAHVFVPQLFIPSFPKGLPVPSSYIIRMDAVDMDANDHAEAADVNAATEITTPNILSLVKDLDPGQFQQLVLATIVAVGT